jgi:hypothetical protein
MFFWLIEKDSTLTRASAESDLATSAAIYELKNDEWREHGRYCF